MTVRKFMIYLVYAFFAGWVVFAVCIWYQLKRHPNFTTGVVTSIDKYTGKGHNQDYSINFEFYVDGEKYYNNLDFDYCGWMRMKQIDSLLVGKRFPVVYPSIWHGLGFIVVTDYLPIRYHFAMPDSIKRYDSLLTCKSAESW